MLHPRSRPPLNCAPGALRATLLACASAPNAPITLALAGVLSTAWSRHGMALLPLPGLDAAATQALLSTWFHGADRQLALDWTALQGAHRTDPRADEIQDLVTLLAEHRAGPVQDGRALAHAVALASLGEQHLWQDLGLPSRRELSALMLQWFPGLVALNIGDMKWKKFFYRQLCLREEVLICKSPSCSVCSDQTVCFGPEEGKPLFLQAH